MNIVLCYYSRSWSFFEGKIFEKIQKIFKNYESLVVDRRVVWRGGFSRVQMIKTEEFSGFPIFVWGPLKEKEKSRLLQDILKIGNTFYRYTGRLFLSSPSVHILAFFTSTPDWTISTVSFTTPVLLVATKIFEICCALQRSSKSCFVLTPLLD